MNTVDVHLRVGVVEVGNEHREDRAVRERVDRRHELAEHLCALGSNDFAFVVHEEAQHAHDLHGVRVFPDASAHSDLLAGFRYSKERERNDRVHTLAASVASAALS